MDTLKLFNEAVSYIEENLTGEIEMKEVARRAGSSEYHFRRMFSFLAGVSLSEYIRYRRLTLAVSDLQDHRVIDLAVKYGYQSADAFSRAFQSWHGVTPAEARTTNKPLKSFSPMTFQLTIRGGENMNVRIVEKDAFRMIGLKKRVPIIFNGVNPEIEKMWHSLTGEDIQELKDLSNIEPKGMISASANFSEGRMEEKGELDHYIGVASTEARPEHFDCLEVQASNWAVFEAKGKFPDTLQNVWGRIYSEWFPTNPYEQAEGPEILWNEQPDTTVPDFKSEIWIPVKKKS
ncbi:AraC family transcriptional regulator [Jeotgalibacillus malaysiensis]|uniref:AraC family transcriptional regulator n=1 Tax=Jeotgalibacillus malaysiensis TaxID=1508404 RepID=A0A0B5AHQ9_9BACL|nr:AraC family transcriptional regulator [Jeotgalibacillus malaysiensis]AJD89611.1 AraC family transcriptional regulator [Jeotgalibacillus malaysiensis]